mgnify:CR=1 FL=1
MRRINWLVLALAIFPVCGAVNAQVDAAAAEALAKKSGCLKCHSADKKRDGPSLKDIAAKYKGQSDGAERVFKHVTTNPRVKVDGVEETHDSLKTKDEKEIRNVVNWILNR